MLSVFAEAMDMAGETGYYKNLCLLQKLASAQKHDADIQKLSRDQLSIKMSNFSNQNRAGYSSA